MWLIDLNVEKTHLVLFDQSNNTVAISVKMDVAVLEEKSYIKMLYKSYIKFFLDWDSYVISVAKTAPKKIGTLGN